MFYGKGYPATKVSSFYKAIPSYYAKTFPWGKYSKYGI